MTDPTKPRRRRFGLSLRALMVVVLIVGGVLGWKARRATFQRKVVAAITAAGGYVKYDYEWGTSPTGDQIFLANPKPWAPGWLRKPIGDEYFQEVATVLLFNKNLNTKVKPDATLYETVARIDSVDSVTTLRYELNDRDFARLMAMPRHRDAALMDIDVTDAGLDCLEFSPAIEKLQLRFKPGTITARGLEAICRQPRLKKVELIYIDLPNPADLAPLAKLPRLEYLRLHKSPQDDACLVALRDLTALKELWLHETQLTDNGVATLARLDQLETLGMDGTKLTDAGLDRLANHSRLKNLYLIPAPNLTDAGLASLARLRSMTYLHLPKSKLTDAGLVHLQGLPLESLAISGEGVTDAGLATLQQIPTLRTLEIHGTTITWPALEAFRKARPNVQIQGGPNPDDEPGR